MTNLSHGTEFCICRFEDIAHFAPHGVESILSDVTMTSPSMLCSCNHLLPPCFVLAVHDNKTQSWFRSCEEI